MKANPSPESLTGSSGHERGWALLKFRLVMIYAVLASLWIIFSDLALATLVPQASAMAQWSLIKGLLFVFLTAILVNFLIARASRDIKQLEKRFRIFADNTYDWEYWISPGGKILYVSPACLRVTGYKPEDFYTDSNLLNKIVHPEDRAIFESHTCQGDDAEVIELDYRIINRNGQVRWISHTCRSVVDLDGQPSGRRASNRDITDKKNSEIERIDLERHLEQQQKLETVGVLASSVAHDINSPLTGIISYAYLIKNQEEEEPQANEQYADEIVHEATRIAGMVKSLLSLARTSHEERQVYSPAELVDGVDMLVRTILRQDNIKIEVDIPDLPRIQCAKEQIQQVLLNLIMNGRDALNAKYDGADSRKVITVRAHQFNDESGRWVRFSVEDQGVGISPELQQKMFNPFFTTKPRGSGTGLGLSISRRIIEDHNGRLSVESKMGEWTRFDVDLPMASAQKMKMPA